MTFKTVSIEDKTLFQRNYVDTLALITPNVYFNEDIGLSGTQIDLISQVINGHLGVASDDLFGFIDDSGEFPDMSTISGLGAFFVKQNGYTNITPLSFERNILAASGFNKTLASFSTSAEFKTFVDDELIPSFKLNDPSTVWATPTLGARDFCLKNFGWFYILNTSAGGGLTFEPSSYISDRFVDTIYARKSLNIVDGIRGLNKFLWENQNVSSVYKTYIPDNYLSEVNVSGREQLDTLSEIIYNNKIVDRSDDFVKVAIDQLISDGTLLTATESAGPFFRLLKAFGFGMYDTNAEIDKLNTLYDIERCPEDLLPFLSQVIGWKLLTNDPEKWRHQLRRAVNIYKAKGTKKALETALNTVVPSSVFSPLSGLRELYESYIPQLIYFALKTDSVLFRDRFDSWTPVIAQSLGVSDYTFNNFDTNIRYAVDFIIRQIAQEFPDHFSLGGTKWDLDDPNFVFNYRERDFNIPPWEEVRYYEDQQISLLLINKLIEVISCFGVTTSFATSFGNFIKEWTVDSTFDEVTIGNSWLFYTASSVTAPNFDALITSSNQDLVSYLPLWNGKSAAFKISFNVSNFDFSSVNYDSDSYLSIIVNSRFINEFSPFTSLPKTQLFFDTSIDTEEYLTNSCIDIKVNKDFEVQFTSGSDYASVETSGVDFGQFGHDFSRQTFLLSSHPNSSINLSVTAPRSTVRRRNFRMNLPRSGLYTRTGFSAPTNIIGNVSSGEYLLYASSMFVLGYNPSTQQFQPVTSSTLAKDGVWNKCQNLTASTIFSSVDTSNTYPFRGIRSIVSALECDRYVTRGELEPITRVMHRVGLQRELEFWEDNIPEFDNNNVPTSFSALSTDLPASFVAASGTFPSSLDDYFRFSFGNGPQYFYRDYTGVFLKHKTSPDILSDKEGGFNIISHTYGPLLFNGNFTVEGSAVTITSASLISSSIVNVPKIDYNGNQGVLSVSGGSSLGTAAVSSFDNNDYYVGNFELRNQHLWSGVELVGTSGASEDNYFRLYKPGSNLAEINSDNSHINNGYIQQVAINGLPRLRFDFKNGSDNILVPEHDFKLKVKLLPGDFNGTLLGGSKLGVWIHTEPEEGLMWSFVSGPRYLGVTNPNCPPPDQWIQHPATLDGVSLLQVKQKLSHEIVFDPENISDLSSCYSEEHINNDLAGFPIATDVLFKTVTINLNTKNKPIAISREYASNVSQTVHRLNQKYVVEVFIFPNTTGNKFFLYDSVTIEDLTEQQRVIEYQPEEVLHILRFYNQLMSSTAPRSVEVSEAVYNTSGGSRVSYRLFAEWRAFIQDSVVGNYESIELRG